MAFVPENELEAALVAAATNPEARPRFYEMLARSELLIVDENPEPGRPIGPHVLEAGRTGRSSSQTPARSCRKRARS